MAGEISSDSSNVVELIQVKHNFLSFHKFVFSLVEQLLKLSSFFDLLVLSVSSVSGRCNGV